MQRVFISYLSFYIFYSFAFIRSNFFPNIEGLEYLLLGLGVILFSLNSQCIIVKRFFSVITIYTFLFLSLFISKSNYDQDYFDKTFIPLIGSFIMALFTFTIRYTITDYRKVLTSFLYGIIFASCIQVFNYLFPSILNIPLAPGGRYTIAGVDPNEFSILMILGLIIMTYLKKFSKRRYFLLLFLFVFSILLTGSRTGFIALIAVGLFFFLNMKTHLVTKLFVITAVCLLGYYIIVNYIPDYISDRLFNIGKDNTEGDSDKMSGRTYIWEHAVLVLKNSSPSQLLFGYGTNSFTHVLSTKYVEMNAHNVFLKVFLELGVIGELILIWILLHLFRAGNMMESHKVYFFSILIVLIVSFLTLSWIYNASTVFIFSMLFNLLIFSRLTKSQK